MPVHFHTIPSGPAPTHKRIGTLCPDNCPDADAHGKNVGGSGHFVRIIVQMHYCKRNARSSPIRGGYTAYGFLRTSCARITQQQLSYQTGSRSRSPVPMSASRFPRSSVHRSRLRSCSRNGCPLRHSAFRLYLMTKTIHW